MMPTALFPREEILLTPDKVSGMIIVATSRPFFTAEWIGGFIRIHGVPVRIEDVMPPGRIMVSTGWSGDLPSITSDAEWEEPAFSNLHGWPASITFHQNRLVIGGSKSHPNRLWFSKTGDYMNFNLGKGLDDDAIEFDMLSDKMNEITMRVLGPPPTGVHKRQRVDGGRQSADPHIGRATRTDQSRLGSKPGHSTKTGRRLDALHIQRRQGTSRIHIWRNRRRILQL
jgi:hypothetical protein